MEQIDVYLEIGSNRCFAGVIDWPGWCRSGRDEKLALQAVLDFGPRYAQVIEHSGFTFHAPIELSRFKVVEQLTGNAATDFGAPSIIPTADRIPSNQSDLERFQAVLRACWKSFDIAVQQSKGKELSKGPRGGGRELDKILEHVVEADKAYLKRIGQKANSPTDKDDQGRLELMRLDILNSLETNVGGGLTERGPRGGVIWPVRYFVRRVAWHVLDHAWEIEDRLT